ncbi:hypothetical protein JCM10213_004341 [Rhodosporidiobolus nylandii]
MLHRSLYPARTAAQGIARLPYSTSARAKVPRTASPPSPPPPSLDIRLSTPRYVVLNKPAGVALQGQHGSPARKGWDDLLAALRKEQGCEKAVPVHRLDKSTTGCLLLALSPLLASRLQTQLQQHAVKRTYLAVVHGRIKPGFVGAVDGRLRMDDDRVRVCDEADGVEARTDWECLDSSKTGFSLLRLKPQTGRKHQLRIHCADVLRAPIVGDFKLSPTSPHAPALASVGLPLDTVLLHAASLSFFNWAKNGKRETLTAVAPVPKAFERFCRAHKLSLPPLEENEENARL